MKPITEEHNKDNDSLIKRVEGRILFPKERGNVKDVDLFSEMLSLINTVNRELEHAVHEWCEAQSNYDSLKMKLRGLK